MNLIRFPILKEIHIKNFSLFNNYDFKYKFIEGVNLIIGGNGTGKTTLINLIKYALIGLYRKESSFTRIYKGKKLEKRKTYPKSYFRNRMDDSYSENEEAEISLTFILNNVRFKVKRDLYRICIKEVHIVEGTKEYSLKGDIFEQNVYERLEDEEKKGCLQYKYEEKVAKEGNFAKFDYFIFFVNNILYFGEDRKTIFWVEEGEEDIQEKLLSQYLIGHSYLLDLDEFNNKAKYYDSLSRHKSEEIKAIKRVLNQLQESGSITKSEDNILNTKEKIKENEEKLNTIDRERRSTEEDLRYKKTKKSKNDKIITEIEQQIDSEKLSIDSTLWEKLHPDYNLFFDNIKSIHICPMCNKKLDEQNYRKIIKNENKCFLCRKIITKSKCFDSKSLKEFESRLEIILKENRNFETDICQLENDLEKLDLRYKSTNIELFKLKSNLRNIERLLRKENKKEKKDTVEKSDAYKAMINRIEELELGMGKDSKKSKEYSIKARNISTKMEQQKSEITMALSNEFNEYAKRFLNLNCKLTYDVIGGGKVKRYIPIIDNKPRYTSEELSESQRFFIDQSFRMSVLGYFTKSSSFFICETPDASLDISYERNAAEVFIHYLKGSNLLILTCNFNKSEFINHVIEKARRIDYIDLLEVGKKSNIQIDSRQLKQLSRTIRRKIDGKRK